MPQYTDDVFRGHFRMSRETMQRLVTFCEEKAPDRNWGGNETPMSMEEMVHVTVWYLANQSVIREIALLFGRSIASIWRAIDRVTSILEKNQECFIKWPSHEEAPGVAEKFAEQTGFPGVLGVMDGTLIKIDCPKVDGNAYICRKHHHALNCLAVVLPDRTFSYVISGFPGR